MQGDNSINGPVAQSHLLEKGGSKLIVSKRLSVLSHLHFREAKINETVLVPLFLKAGE